MTFRYQGKFHETLHPVVALVIHDLPAIWQVGDHHHHLVASKKYARAHVRYLMVYLCVCEFVYV